ncbi:MAG: hypothetical protein HWE07_02150 [Cytophagia bacterium]|nr:hypothetical protein [Cytophagia bacterium]
MGVTRLKRKGRRNKQRSAQRTNQIKQLTAKPVLKNVDKEELIASFKAEEPKNAPKAKKEEAPVEEAPKAEAKKEKAPKAEDKKEKAPKAKAAPKKKEAKAEEAPAKEETKSEEDAAEK